jgi:4-amino-4-deoxy-L-arabinose transferase-like glycosyltransferase
VLAGLSTAAGVLSLALTFLLGRELLGTRVALAAVALAGTSPLQLAMGRRALQDEPFCAASLLFFWLLALYLRKTHERFSALSWVAAVAAATLAFAVKESFLLVIPAVVVALVVARAPRRPRLADLGICVVPPVLFGLGSAIAAGGFGRLLHLANVVRGFALRPPYALEYQAGPPHRVLFDLFVLSPVVCLLAVAGVTLVAYRLGGVDRWAAWVAAVLVVTLLVFSFLASKNVRYVIMADPLLRVLAAWVLVGRPLVTVRWLFPVTAAVIVCSGAVELAIFHRVFVTGAVYDPVTENLLRALGAISH